MITDMVRNDLGRIARPGTARVPRLFETEPYPTVWQMTSTVEARTDAGLADLFAALFPCASITGAPKVRATELIADLESSPRGVYTGAIGYAAPGCRAQFNVAIRTVSIDHAAGTAEYVAFGFIVWDSRAANEYAEALAKTRLLDAPPADTRLLETLLWRPGRGWFLRRGHLRRLAASARRLGFCCDRARRGDSSRCSRRRRGGVGRVRLTSPATADRGRDRPAPTPAHVLRGLPAPNGSNPGPPCCATRHLRVLSTRRAPAGSMTCCSNTRATTERRCPTLPPPLGGR